MPAFDRLDIVVVPFPFVDAPVMKRRPALALVSAAFVASHGQGIFAMITSARHSRWPSDVPFTDQVSAGLTAPSMVRWKVFTLPESVVERRLGRLGAADAEAVTAALRRVCAS
jgi:mRNA interferase MazF